MNLSDVIEFKSDLYFQGAVDVDWFYDNPNLAKKVAESFAFHGKNYHGANIESKNLIDTISFVKEISNSNILNLPILAIADYGTGKSHLALTLANLLSSPSFEYSVSDKVLGNIQKIESDSSLEIEKFCKKPSLVLVLKGGNFNLNTKIIEVAQKSLALWNIDSLKLRTLSNAIDTASKFLTLNKNSSILDFENVAKDYSWTEKGEELISKLEKTLITENQETFEIVNSVYTQKNGSPIQWDKDILAKDVLNLLCAEYCGENKPFEKVVLLFDEFGRYIEYASESISSKSGDFALQDIFEEIKKQNGKLLKVVPFIQCDIKTYLDRVNPSSQLSKYIDRYNASKKYYLSSNLETVFANLIFRKDEFYNTIKPFIEKKNYEWNFLFKKMNEWISLKGLWKDNSKFKDIIVEGIYPFHPISTFMLTQLSDYFQKRSALTIANSYISSDSDSFSLIYPEELLKGDLFDEMKIAESSGRKTTNECLKYESVLKKMYGKLDSNSQKILRANLSIKIINFKTSGYEDTIDAISICSNLEKEEIKDSLKILVDEYAVLNFDNRSNSFDFMEEANGNYDYRIIKNRVLKTSSITPDYIVTNQKILELSGLFEQISTDFNFRISTNEWKFIQHFFIAENFSLSVANSIYAQWQKSKSCETPKGHLIWLYLNNKTPQETFNSISGISKNFKNTPIVIMLLKDSDFKLFEFISEYKALLSISENDRRKFDKFYKEDLISVEDKIRNQFELLKKERNYFDENGNLFQLTSRLSSFLSQKFAKVYEKSLPFIFDSFVMKNGTCSSKSITNLISILKMILTDSISKDNLDSNPELQTRFNSLLMNVGGENSWKCVDSNYKIIEPNNESVKDVYNFVVHKFNLNNKFSIKSIFDKLEKEPYGSCDYVILLFVSIVLSNLRFVIRLNTQSRKNLSTLEWSDFVLVKEQKKDGFSYKADFSKIKETEIIKVDESAEKQILLDLCKKINSCTDIFELPNLRKFFDELTFDKNIPFELKKDFETTANNLSNDEKLYNAFMPLFNEVTALIDTAEKGKFILKALNAIKKVENFSKEMEKEGFKISIGKYNLLEVLKNQNIITRAKIVIEQNFNNWLKSNLCKNPLELEKYAEDNEKIAKRLDALSTRNNFSNFSKFAFELRKHIKVELEAVNLRQQKSQKIENFISNHLTNSFDDSYEKIMEKIKLSGDLISEISSFTDYFDYQTKLSYERIVNFYKEKSKFISNIDENVEKLKQTISSIKNSSDLQNSYNQISSILKNKLQISDFKYFEKVQTKIKILLNDITEISQSNISLEKFNEISDFMNQKYSNNSNVYPIILDELSKVKFNIQKLENVWVEKNLTIIDNQRRTLLEWKEKTKILPDYLSYDTKNKVEEMDKKVNELLSEDMIQTVIDYFEKLSSDERKKCLEQLQNL